MDVLSLFSLGLGALGLSVGVPALRLAWRAERRSQERHDVNWHIDFCPSGHLHVHNLGRSTAHGTVVYVETSEGLELDSGAPKDFGPGEEWTTELREHLIRRIGTTFFAHVRVEWETSLGTARMQCHTAEREDAHITVDPLPLPQGRSTKQSRSDPGRGHLRTIL